MKKHSRDLRILAFVGSVLVISQLGDMAMEMVADRFPGSGFAKLRTYMHKGVTTS